MNSRIVATWLPVCLVLSLGCTARKNPGEARGAMPSEGKVRVLFTKVKEKSDFTHYKWSFVGDRNWEQPVCNNSTFEVTKSSKLNAPESRGGCFTWEIDIKSTRTPAAGTWSSIGEIRGSNGKTAKLTSTPSQCLPSLTKDEMVSVGESIALGKLGQAPLSVTFTK